MHKSSLWLAVSQSQASNSKHNASVALARYEALSVVEVNGILSLFFPPCILETHQLNHLSVIGKQFLRSTRVTKEGEAEFIIWLLLFRTLKIIFCMLFCAGNWHVDFYLDRQEENCISRNLARNIYWLSLCQWYIFLNETSLQNSRSALLERLLKLLCFHLSLYFHLCGDMWLQILNKPKFTLWYLLSLHLNVDLSSHTILKRKKLKQK